jgi:hypothetical protein
VNLDVKVIIFVPFFQLVNDTLKTVNIPGALYQWYVCTTNGLVPLLGATQNTLPLIKSDRYALGITFNSCSFISPCVDIILSSVDAIKPKSTPEVYPNPVNHTLFVKVDEVGTYKIWCMSGRLLDSGALSYLNSSREEIEALSH